MVRTLALVGVAALLAAGAASASRQTTASLSNAAPGARHVGVEITLQDVLLRCGQPNATTVSITLPRATGVPASIPRRDVRVAGQLPQSVRMDGSTIVLTLASAAKGMTCDMVAFGPVQIDLTPGAGLRNPRREGTYGFSVTLRPRRHIWRGVFSVLAR